VSATPVNDYVNSHWPDDERMCLADRRDRAEFIDRRLSTGWHGWRIVPRPPDALFERPRWEKLSAGLQVAGGIVSRWLDDVALAEFDGDYPSQQPKSPPGEVPVVAIIMLVEDTLARGELVDAELIALCVPFLKSGDMFCGIWASRAG
jgi:hypothetical protein